MKAVLWMTVFLGVTAAESGRADPTVTSQDIKCDYQPKIDKWEPRGFVEPQTQGYSINLNFRQSLDDFGPYPVATTGNPSEHRVQVKCKGSLTLSNDRPFKIRDFKFVLGDLLGIGSAQGKIDLKVQGVTTVTNTNQNDSFEKLWTIRQNDIGRPDVLAGQQESNTVCGQSLTLRFNDLGATAIREVSSFEFTELELESLNINFDRC